MKGIKYIIFVIFCCLLSVFMFRVAFTAKFDNVVNDPNYWEYNLEDNQISNLKDINVSFGSFLDFFRSFPNYFDEAVANLLHYNIFKAMAEETNGLFLFTQFYEFMSTVYTFLVYIAAALLTILKIVTNLLEFVFTNETFTTTETTVIVPNVG